MRSRRRPPAEAGVRLDGSRLSIQRRRLEGGVRHERPEATCELNWAGAAAAPKNLTPNPFPSGKGNQIKDDSHCREKWLGVVSFALTHSSGHPALSRLVFLTL